MKCGQPADLVQDEFMQVRQRFIERFTLGQVERVNRGRWGLRVNVGCLRALLSSLPNREILPRRRHALFLPRANIGAAPSAMALARPTLITALLCASRPARA